ncbi:tripartite motif-containing protein 2-like [Symsagittifera roscoffensis]|uniref:tripartite motif-containing protein 2-like n=1 Tax=Symsagittifera roscoffensis TaxID=84072 RepID=UPI00307B57D0
MQNLQAEGQASGLSTAASSSICEEHPREIKDLFCQKCEVSLCSECVHSDHRGSPHRVLSIEAAKKRREQVGISLEAFSRSVKEASETLSKMNAYIQTFISNDLQRAEDICNIYQQSSIYERELKKKREVLDEALEEQRILVARFHREAKKELDEKFTAVEDALRKVGDQN